MKLKIISTVFVLSVLSCGVEAEEVKEKTRESFTIVTYYPSPYGSYKRLHVQELVISPSESFPGDVIEGLIFFSNGQAQDDSGNKLSKGLWIYLQDKWYPLAISLGLSQLKNLNLDANTLDSIDLEKLDFNALIKGLGIDNRDAD